MADLRQTPEWAQFLASLNWKTEKIGSNYLYIRFLPLLGSIIKIPRSSWPLDLKKLDQIAKKYRTLFVKLEPKVEIEMKPPVTPDLADKGSTLTTHPILKSKNLATIRVEPLKIKALLKKRGFQEENWTLTPSKTLVLDIKKSEADLLASFEKDTRYSINLASRKGIGVQKSTDFDTFYELYKQTSKRKGFWIGSKKEVNALYNAFSTLGKAELLVAYTSSSSTLLGGCLVFYEKESKTAYYHLAASSEEKRELMAPYLLIWEAIRTAKKKGYQYFDFEGIYDPRYKDTRKWQGFTHFKKGFRGKEITYLGSVVKYYNPVLKLIHSLFSRFT